MIRPIALIALRGLRMGGTEMKGITVIKRVCMDQTGRPRVRYAILKDARPFREYSEEEYESFKRGMEWKNI